VRRPRPAIQRRASWGWSWSAAVWGPPRYLLHAATVSDGYAALWERGYLELTVEAMILQPKRAELFTDEERQIAVTRLRSHGFTGPLPDAAD
jgi:hypothetical protein